MEPCLSIPGFSGVAVVMAGAGQRQVRFEFLESPVDPASAVGERRA